MFGYDCLRLSVEMIHGAEAIGCRENRPGTEEEEGVRIWRIGQPQFCNPTRSRRGDDVKDFFFLKKKKN